MISFLGSKDAEAIQSSVVSSVEFSSSKAYKDFVSRTSRLGLGSEELVKVFHLAGKIDGNSHE